MKNMTQAREFVQAAPPGRYLSTIVDAEATVSKKSGASMLHLTVQIDDPRYAGDEADDYIITDGTAKGASMGKRKLRGISTPSILRAIDTDEDVPDAVIARELIGLQLFVDYGNEQKLGKADANDPNSPYDRPMTIMDEKTGREVALNKLTVAGYSRHSAGQAQAAAPIQQVAPQQFAQPQAPQGFVPQQFPGQQAPQGQWPGQPQPGFAPQQAAPFNGGAPQQAFPQGGQMQPAFPQGGVAQPAWNGGQQVAPQQAAPAADEKPKRTRRVVES